MIITKEQTVGEIVAKDLRTAAVFDKLGIDFCCKGNRSLEEVCGDARLSFDELVKELEGIDSTTGSGIDYNSWPLDLLADYIEKKHHRYVTEQTPVLKGYLDKLCSVHGDKHPELFEIRQLFAECAGELAMHMKKEELMLFPFIRKMAQAKQSGGTLQPAPFGTIRNPVNAMLQDHTTEGERFERIAQLSDNYTVPADGCNTYRITLAGLKEFEKDLHLHIHLENNILFPKAIVLEEELLDG